MGSLRQHVQTGASVVESAMSRVGSGTAGAGLLADRGDAESRLRRTVAAGPGGAVEVGDTVLGGVLRSVADAGHVDRRSRVLTGVVVVAAVLGLCLFRRENYDLVLARVLAGSPRRVIDGGPPTGQALSTARTRLAPQAMRTVFEQAAACMPAAGPGSYAFGLLLTAFDGTVFDLAATADITAQFATPSAGRFPQARLVTLVACGTRWILAARLGCSGLSEQHLVDQLLDTLLPGTLNLPDRLVEFTLAVTDSTGRARTSRFRILTTLLDHEQYPAGQIAAVYAERWQVEVIYLRVKSTLRGAGTRLRGQTPALAVQEIWGLLTVYNALVGLAVAAAVVLGVDPDAISFAAVLALTRTSATTDLACVQCGHRSDPVDDLVTAITAQPRNRTTRKRTSPRTKTQRQTERTRDVSYTITIVASNLPKDQ